MSRSRVYVNVFDGWRIVVPLKRTIEARVPGATFHAFHGASVIELRPTTDGRPAVRTLFEVLADRLKARPEIWRVYHALAWLRFEDGDPEGARDLARRLQKLHPKLKHESDKILRAVKQRQRRADRQRATGSTK